MDIINCLSARSHCRQQNQPVATAVSVYHRVDGDFLLSQRHRFMHSKELDYYNGLGHQSRAVEFLMGRYAAKHALSTLSGNTDFRTIVIDRSVFQQPLVVRGDSQPLDVSISHKKDIAVSLAHSVTHPMGIDLESIHATDTKVLQSQLTATELLAIKHGEHSAALGIRQLWAIKEALSKVLRTGLTARFEVFETCDYSSRHADHLQCNFSNFYQYEAQCWRLGSYVMAVVYPRCSSFVLDRTVFFRGLTIDQLAARENKQ